MATWILRTAQLSVLLLISWSGLANDNFKLSAECPIYFEKQSSGLCNLSSLYNSYPGGFGGVRRNFLVKKDGLDPRVIDLGRYLFFDKILSGDKSLSCATCHDPQQGFSDGRARSVGIHDTPLNRAAPSLWNVGFMKTYFWDGRASTLEEQAAGPLFADVEMGNSRENLESDLNANPIYPGLFKEAFKERMPQGITWQLVVEAIAGFERTLVSLNSRYDWYTHGVHSALNEKEIEGMNVFRSFVTRCQECHTPPLFSNHEFAVIGVPEPEGVPFDEGAGATLKDNRLRGGFRIPPLRNITKTAPYMHSGKFDNLEDVVKFYSDGGGRTIEESKDLNLHWHIVEAKLKKQEIENLVLFLDTLTDESALPKIPEAVPSGIPVTNQILSRRN